MTKILEHKNFPMFFLLFIAVLFFVRYPPIFTEPRFYAEEATVYYKFALEHDWIEVLTTPQLGYYSLFNNIAVLFAAKVVSIENAPIVTTLMAALIQLVPFLIVIFGRSELWQTNKQKLVVSAIILFVGHGAEIWMNTLNTQFHLSLITFLILLEDLSTAGLGKKIAYVLLIIVAGLTGAASCILAPLYVFKAHRKSGKNFKKLATILSAALALQLYILANNYADITSIRSVQLTPESYISGLVSYNFLGIFSGWHSSSNIFLFLADNPIILVLLPIAIVWLLYIFSRGMSVDNKVFFLGSYLIISIISTYFSIHAAGGVRYAYSTNVILVLMMMQYLPTLKNKLAPLVLVWPIAIGCILFFALHFVTLPKWPVWQEEVKQWRMDKTRKLTVHPPHWHFNYSGD